MTEIASGVIKWAKKQESVRKIVASTEKVNISSANVLKKNNFVIISETESIVKWELAIKT